jgi:hypothetical protein
MMALAFGPTSCSSGLVPKSKLLHSPAVQYGFVPKHSHHGGKYPALRAEKPIIACAAQCAAFLAKRSVAVFLLSLISKHGMLRVGLMQTDGS